MELAANLPSATSPLARARLLRQLPVREAAAKAGLTVEQVTWLEEGRVYRFATPDDALLALLLYATALGIDHREARSLAGLPVPPKALQVNPYARLAVLGAAAVALVALIAALTLPGRADDHAREARLAQLAADARLPRPWTIHVDVRNGSGDINYTRRVASRIGALGYDVARVGRADRFDYQETAVYYQRGGQPIADRLARQLGVTAKPLPGGKDARRLVVVVGPQRGPG
jgi:transcriptional regulator with XRE-family HTH domain